MYHDTLYTCISVCTCTCSYMCCVCWVSFFLSSSPATAPNSGLVLWFQQFCAMFLKRFYNSLRFWQAIITQLIMPLLFVLLALILAVTLPNINENDPPRALNVENSALDGSAQLLFYAEFGAEPSAVFDFEVSSSISLHVSPQYPLPTHSPAPSFTPLFSTFFLPSFPLPRIYIIHTYKYMYMYRKHPRSCTCSNNSAP